MKRSRRQKHANVGLVRPHDIPLWAGAAAGPSTDAQAAARAEFNMEKADDFYSSDEDDTQSSAAASDVGGPKFKVGGSCFTSCKGTVRQQMKL